MAPAQTGRSRPPVMADVARLAGVSHQTVSRVLNDHPNVRPQTRDNVLAAIAELGYRPNAAARTLVTRRTRTLGVVSFDTTLYGPASMLYGIERAEGRCAHDAARRLHPGEEHLEILGRRQKRRIDAGCAQRIGTLTETLLPRACARMSRPPPSSRTRSRMLAKPTPSPSCVVRQRRIVSGGMPCP